MLAPSGAKIGVRDSYTVTCHPPKSPVFFTILQQLQEFNGDTASVKWALMNGSINDDAEIQQVFNPMIPQYELEWHGA